MKILLLGGSGQLGTQFLRRWSEADIHSPARAQLDVEDRKSLERVLGEIRPDLVLNCAAYNDVPKAEKEPQRAFAINAAAPGAMAELCARCESIFVTFSTDYVFDGNLGREYVEGDLPDPLNAYGRSKLAGEENVLRLKTAAYVIRTSGLYGTTVSTSKGQTFIHRILSQAKTGEPLRVVGDQSLSPTYAGHLALTVREMLEKKLPYGLYHAVNEGAVSWFDFAAETLRQAGLNTPVQKISSAEFSSNVRRPAFSALENQKLHAQGLRMPRWREGISAFLRDSAGQPD